MESFSRSRLSTDALEYLRAGTSVNVRGLPGSGRTAALTQIAASLEAVGWTVVRLRGIAALSDRPLEVIAFAGLLGQPAARQTTALTQAITGLQAALNGPRCVVAIDDCDLLDAASISAVGTALDGRSIPLLSSASTARAAQDMSLDAIVRPGVRLVMPPLGFDASYEIVQEICDHGSVSTDTVARIHSRGGGLPGLVHAIADIGVHEGLLTQDNGVWSAGTRLWSPRLAFAVEPFLQGLGPETLSGLIKLSLVGAIDVSVAKSLVGWSELEELDDRGLLTFLTGADQVSMSVYPPLLAEHLRNERAGARRLRILDEINEALARSEFTSGELGRQLPDLHRAAAPLTSIRDRGAFMTSSGGDPHDLENRAAAEAVLNRLVHEKLLSETLDRRAALERDRDAKSALEYVTLLMVQGADVEAIDAVLAEAMRGTTPQDRVRLTAARALLWALGALDPDKASELLDAQLPLAGAWAPALEARRAQIRLQFTGAPAAPHPLPQAIVSPLVLDEVRLTRAQELIAIGRPRAAIAELDLVRTDAARVATRVSVFHAVALAVAGDLDGAEAAARRNYDDALARLDLALLTGHGYVIALVHSLRGDDARLRDHLLPLLSLGFAPLCFLPFQLGIIVSATRFAARLGQPATARSLADQAEALGLHLGPHPGMLAAQARAHAEVAGGGDPSAAADALWTAAEDAYERRYLITALLAGVQSIKLDAVPQRAEAMVRWAEDAEPDGLAAMLADFAAATVASDPYARLASASRLRRRGFAGLALSLQVAAATDLADRDPERANVEIRRACTLATQLGGEYPRYTAALTSRALLTGRERQVAELAVAGLTNGEIAGRLQLSVRTVESHLYRVFRKLGVQDRHDLAAALHSLT
ncbi:LuxR C-terminal-related transcriptional regulator [Microbacterium sp. BWT-B31]|uniref:helix-turn-helix transcriptional regulator n=1 Tax=Microbacterium sp. BWT-B31 TaxID=3232072 RepID=UPI0035271EC9